MFLWVTFLTKSHLCFFSVRTHMQNIKDITSSIHYEVYRVRRLNETNAQPNGQPPNTLVNPQQDNGVAAQF